MSGFNLDQPAPLLRPAETQPKVSPLEPPPSPLAAADQAKGNAPSIWQGLKLTPAQAVGISGATGAAAFAAGYLNSPMDHRAHSLINKAWPSLF